MESGFWEKKSGFMVLLGRWRAWGAHQLCALISVKNPFNLGIIWVRQGVVRIQLGPPEGDVAERKDKKHIKTGI